jgi:hypothetical protein
MKHLKTFESYNRHMAINEEFDLWSSIKNLFSININTKSKIDAAIEEFKNSTEAEVAVIELEEKPGWVKKLNKILEKINEWLGNNQKIPISVAPTNEELFVFREIPGALWNWICRNFGIIGGLINLIFSGIEFVRTIITGNLSPFAWLYVVAGVIFALLILYQNRKPEQEEADIIE